MDIFDQTYYFSVFQYYWFSIQTDCETQHLRVAVDMLGKYLEILGHVKTKKMSFFPGIIFHK